MFKYLGYGILAYIAFFGLSFFGPNLRQKWEDFRSDVVVLTDSNFESVVSAEKEIMVEFYAPWCGHCKRLKPHYEEAATKLRKDSIKIAKVNNLNNSLIVNILESNDMAGKFQKSKLLIHL